METYILTNKTTGDVDYVTGDYQDAYDSALDWSVGSGGNEIIISDDCGKPLAYVWA